MYGVLAAKNGEFIDIISQGTLTVLNGLLIAARKTLPDNVQLKVIEIDEDEVQLIVAKQDLIQTTLEKYFEED